MPSDKISISLSHRNLRFVETYRARRHRRNRSQVFEEALELLRKKELEASYKEASKESIEGWDSTVSDGLADETW